jgi:DNA replication protein DnaC
MWSDIVGKSAVAADRGVAPHLYGLHMSRLMLCTTLIDDWGPEPLNAEQRRGLLEIVDDREGKGSLLMTSQVPIGRWHEIIGDPTLGDAILDRVIHRAHRVEG